MNLDLAQELLNQLGSSLEKLETQHAALLQFLKDNGTLKDEQFAPYLAQAEKASGVRWLAARLRLESLIRSERENEEKLREIEHRQTGAGQAPAIQNQERAEETKNEAANANAAPQSDEARKQSVSENGDKKDVNAISKEKKPSYPS